MTNDNGGILGINAGGFVDPEGLGTGGEPSGLVISNGNIVNEIDEYDYYSTAWMDTSNNFNVGTHVNFETVRDAVQFFPILVANGKKVVSGSYGLGIQPRTAIGQAVSGDILILAIDGRQLGYSLGTDVSECADILVKYGAWNAMNMDGGSSTELVYKGLTINKPSSVGENGRSIATAWIVYPLK
jgi:exopolysaccharide biosynthesis protein